LGLRSQEAEIPAHGQLVTDGKEYHSIRVTDANEIILVFGTNKVVYFCLTDLSGKLRRVFMFEAGSRYSGHFIMEIAGVRRWTNRKPGKARAPSSRS
jgi:hypothetical protein